MLQNTIRQSTVLIGQLSAQKRALLANILFTILAFFLARAVFFEAAVPFFLPFWAILQRRFQGYIKMTFISGVIGAITLSIGQGIILILQWVLYVVLRRYHIFQHAMPLQVAFATLFVQVVWQLIIHGGMPPILVQMYVLYEFLLALLMTIFMQQFFVEVPKFLFHWPYERIASGFFICAAALTGMHGMTIGYFSLALFMLHFMICLTAYIGTIASTVLLACIVATVLNIAQFSLTGILVVYTLTGVLTGACSHLPRGVIASISLLPSVFFFLYDATLPLDSVYFVSICCATIAFLVIPKKRILIIKQLTQQNEVNTIVENEQWIRNNMIDSLQQFKQFTLFMKDLVLNQFAYKPTNNAQKIEPYLTCSSCFRYEHCWGQQESGISDTIQRWFLYKSGRKHLDIMKVEEQLKLKCIKTAKLVEELEERLYHSRMEQQLYHGKKMVALQLHELSNHMEQLIENLSEHSISFQQLEQEIIESLALKQIFCLQVDVLESSAGACEIICSFEMKTIEKHPHIAQEIIEPILQTIFNEPITLYANIIQNKPFTHIQLTFRSAVRFQLDYNIYSQAKQGMVVSGDAHSVFSLHNGLVAVVLSDGVGSSEVARRQSEHLIKMIKSYLNYDLNPETAMHTLHYVMSLQQDDLYATVDFSLIDLQQGALWSWKAGGMSTYILRGRQVILVESGAAPVGFMPSFTVETKKISLCANDKIIMVSDGIFTNEDSWYEQESFLLSLLQKHALQNTALSVLLYETLDEYKMRYRLNDDCTVIVMTIQHVRAEWSTFKPAEHVSVSG